MKNIAYHILDIAQNAIQAEATEIKIHIDELDEKGTLSISIADDGRGMTEEQVRKASDPYFTSRNTRNVGMGLALLKQNTEWTGGSFQVDSEVGMGTIVKAIFIKDNIDCPTKGDISGIIHQLITSNPRLEFFFRYTKNENSFELDTREVKQVLDGMPLNHREISGYLKEMIEENLVDIQAGEDISYKHEF